MRILKLKLRGAVGIKKGLGLDEVELDFTQFQPGLIALTGRNGSGKTTVMENLHPFRQMVSRGGSLQSHFFLKDSYRILDFELDGKNYQSKILIDALTGGSEAYLFRDCSDDPTKLYGNFTPLNDGKLTTYDEAIEKVLGTPELFFNSVFSGQKSKGIAELKPADRRKLFYELLSLNSYEVYLEHAKAELKKQELRLAEVEGEARAIENGELRIENLEEERVQILERQKSLIDEIFKLEAEIDQHNEMIKEFEIDIRTSEDKLKGNEEIEKRIAQISGEIELLTKNNNSRILRYNSEVEDYQKLIVKNKELSAKKDELAAMLVTQRENQISLAKLQEQKSELQKEVSVIQETNLENSQSLSRQEKRMSELRKELLGLEMKAEGHLQNLERMKKDTAIIDRVPCDVPTGKSCEFLINAYATKKELDVIIDFQFDSQIADQKSLIAQAERNYERDKQLFDEKYSVEMAKLKDEMDVIVSEINRINKSLGEIAKNNIDKQHSDSLEAQNNIQLYEQKIESAQTLINETKENFEKEFSRLKTEAGDLQSKLDIELPKKISQLKENLSTERCQLQSTATKKNIRIGLMDELKQEVAALEQQIELVKKNAERIALLNEEKKKVENEIWDWTFLCRAFDKTGIPVLKLENSGIEITTIANELLSIFENKFRIVFETTSLTKDKKKLKETFDINIVEEDGVCEISNKSGGQQVWLETAIQLAIALVVRQQGRNLQTSFLDEKDGALDLDNAYAYIEMLRKAHSMSGVYNTFIITHRTELLDFIPQQIKLRDGILEILN